MNSRFEEGSIEGLIGVGCPHLRPLAWGNPHFLRSIGTLPRNYGGNLKITTENNIDLQREAKLMGWLPHEWRFILQKSEICPSMNSDFSRGRRTDSRIGYLRETELTLLRKLSCYCIVRMGVQLGVHFFTKWIIRLVSPVGRPTVRDN